VGGEEGARSLIKESHLHEPERAEIVERHRKGVALGHHAHLSAAKKHISRSLSGVIPGSFTGNIGLVAGLFSRALLLLAGLFSCRQ